MTKSWKTDLKNLVTDVEQLWQILELPKQELDAAKKASECFPLRIPESMISRIKPGDCNDPILKQFLPWHLELSTQPKNFDQDPLKELKMNKIPGLLHKYHGRVLLILSGACAINCRYCFRRHFPYQDHIMSKDNTVKILEYIANDSSISEVIFSGGDPLMLTDESLAKLILPLNEIVHVKTLRFHSRIPIVLPSRIDSGFIEVMKQSRLQKIMVIHSNHAQELDMQVKAALEVLRTQDFFLLNQSVLLRGINDEAQALIDLSNRLFEFNVLPYYLHLLDHVSGAAHFKVSFDKAQELFWQMMQALPGYLVPKLAQEIPGLACKWVYGLDEKFKNL